MAENWQSAGFGLYVHWPYCEAKCPYCDFNSHVARDHGESDWTTAITRELDRAARETPGRVLGSVYFGGGTPSLMHPDSVGRVLDAARGHWSFANDIEITLEANPGSVEAGRFAGYRDAGVNRVSLGVQALNDSDLRRLGRVHDVAQAMKAIETAQACFDRVSFDLIYARQDQTLNQWESELGQALTLAAGHLSLYQLTIEPGTAFGARHMAGGLSGLPDDDLSADMYHLTQALCENAGLPAYEISNHATPGAESRHNQIYWRGGDYVGVGPGAHGRLSQGHQRAATVSASDPKSWIAAVKGGSGETERAALSAMEQAEEYLMMGLRLTEGIDVSRYIALAGHAPDPETLAQLVSIGMIRQNDDRISATPQGRTVLNAVLRELLVA